MNNEQQYQRFLDAQEHPENYTDEELNEILADADGLAQLKRAWFFNAAKQSHVDVNAAWSQFCKHHHAWRLRLPLKIAAASIGIVCLASAAYAAAIGLGLARNPFHHIPAQSVSTDTLKTTTIVKPCTNIKGTALKVVTPKPHMVAFNDAKLSAILTQMAAYYHVQVTFTDAGTRNLRLYFEWDQQKSLDDNIMLLNSFQHIHITHEGNQLTIN